MAVRQVSAVRQIHAENRVAGIQHRRVGGLIRLRSRVRLNIGVFGSEKFLDALPGQVFDAVGVLAAPVVALARIAFGVLIGEYAAGGLQHGFGSEIFARDQFEARILALRFLANEVCDFGIGLRKRPSHAFLFSHGNMILAPPPIWRTVYPFCAKISRRFAPAKISRRISARSAGSNTVSKSWGLMRM